MKSTSSFKLLFATAVIALLFIGAGSAAVTDPSCDVSLSLTPSTLMPGETGQLVVTLQNTGGTPLTIYKVAITDSWDVVSVTHPALKTLGSIGVGKSMTLTFPITANDVEGTFYPSLSIELSNNIQNTFIKYPFAVTVDSKSVSLSVTERPEVFEPDTTQIVGLSIGNLRANQIDSVVVTASGEGVSCEEGMVFAGAIAPGASSDVFLTVITSEKTESINLDVSYKNGANWHTDTLTIPVEGGELKTGAELFVNNIEITSGASYTTITGDVNNAGLQTAKGLVVSLNGAEPLQPYPVFVVGSLDADGLSEFELTFTNPESDSLDLIFTYKDDNGNTYVQEETVSISAVQSAGSAVSGGNPVAAGIAVVLLILIIGGAVFLIWKKGNLIPKKEQK
ncbi:hypothetical protein J6B78_06505 [Methanocorpusculum sp.]|nr:hypothetical protein [Methanocorpusculum sp.]MBO5368220.1 hypothetical protein [Methanocorpusculum sp.]